jgi:hypothetical protein
VNSIAVARAREQVPCNLVLRDAAEYLAEHGWWQGDMFDDPDSPCPRVCALGAIRMSAADVGVEFTTTAGVFADYLVRHHIGAVQPVDAALDWLAGLPESESLVSAWNDDPDRTIAEVIAALYSAAQEWERIKGGAA